MIEHMITRLVEAKKEQTDLIREYNRMAGFCYERGDLKGHEYWVDRAFDHIDMYHDLNRDLKKVRAIAEA